MSSRGADFIVESLVEHGITHAIGLCGHGNIGLLDALRLQSTDIQTVSVHHEQAAGHIADVFFRVAGRPAVTFTSSGPGSTNLPIALATAYYDRSAFLSITGNVPTKQFGLGAFQETYGQGQAAFPEVVRPYVKASYQPTTPTMLVNYTRQALTQLTTGRPAPVHLDVPLDLFTTTDPAFDRPVGPTDLASHVSPTLEAIRAVTDALAASQRPLILVGGGFGPKDQDLLLELARRLGSRIVTTPDGKSAVPDIHEWCLGAVGRNGSAAANAATRDSDLILAINVHFDDRTSSGYLPGATFDFESARLVHVHEDVGELGRSYRPALGVVSDPVHFVEALVRAVGAGPDRSRWQARLDGWRREWHAELAREQTLDNPGELPAEAVVGALRAALPADGMLLSDVGVHHNWLIQRWMSSQPNTFLHSWGFGAMGFAVGGAIGARLAAPGAPVLAVCGDGGFIMNSHAVATAVQSGLPVVWVVWDNHGFVSIRDLQLAFFGGQEHATSFAAPQGDDFVRFDFAKLGRSLGAIGVTADSPDALVHAVTEGLAAGQPTVIHVPVAREHRPLATGAWELPPLPASMPSFTLGTAP
nr:thiamine pyrophosphate-binding protein [Micromonospora sp. DSM 115978]